MELNCDQGEFDDLSLDGLELGDGPVYSRKRTDSTGEENATSCADLIYGPSPPVELKGKTLTSAGKNFEVDFESVDQEEPGQEKDSDEEFLKDAEHQSKRKLKDLYDAGLWAPHPEHYLLTESLLDDSGPVFAKLKRVMRLITEPQSEPDYIYKQVTLQGSGIPVPKGQIVVVYYVAFVDFGDEPVDVAFSKSMKRSFKLQLDKGNALPGFENAIKTMCVGEQSIFIVSPSLAYGERGCPPRYPGNADVFYFIDLVAVLADDPMERVMNLPVEEREHLKFATVQNAAARCTERVAVFYKCLELRRALTQQRWVVDLLERCHVANEEEDVIRKRLLISSLKNAATIACKAKLPKAVLYYAGNILNLDNTHKEALYYRIQAQLELGSLPEALAACRKALKIYPDSITFNQLLEKAAKDVSQEKQKEKKMYQRMLGITPNGAKASTEIQQPPQETALVTMSREGPEDEMQRREDIVEIMKELIDKPSLAHHLYAGNFTMKDLQIMEQIARDAHVKLAYFTDGSGLRKIRLSK